MIERSALERMFVVVNDLQKKIPLNTYQIKKITKIILKHEKVSKVSLSVSFVTDQKICSLNKKFLGLNNATDVLSFDSTDEEVSYTLSPKNVKEVNGDIIISTDAAIKNAKRFNTSVEHELSLYVVHGVLHLLGYDDHSKNDIAKIRKKEKKILGILTNYIKKVAGKL
ncbi:MAG: rRNA maturation RNase YbeY [Omnitrophica WOR_2 bacterium GWF2_38_59]|nr:MAG: rRNA maturation RNase YbeY [Omnitrophica WOR_2 bacterium GWF2_38_59]OGX50642.1 MAG: rRNA maturation RNase YbeY [Omnitrophica WOR_2 bacterium RIFOXYA2_FULL_38_17]OGX54637.1 MAG: rRNA maturation RNase YbeY [Omnitrophica WOR_2 bacterium RIFOXYA12_FULL_38_10]OGX59771.1 MAG: rRNA maturation RNase YbeY [Omnitrophica WOR_2 bacterium RIFOXYB2_FULL_38_16]HBG60941.1 rRNA maturation RNase YbeY [Candidatus Omnitrophota bacterium]